MDRQAYNAGKIAGLTAVLCSIMDSFDNVQREVLAARLAEHFEPSIAVMLADSDDDVPDAREGARTVLDVLMDTLAPRG